MDTHRLRFRIFNVLHRPSAADPVARWVSYSLAALILTNALFVALETVPAIGGPHRVPFWWFELVSTALFGVEYAARLWVSVEQRRFASPVWGRLRYALQPLPLLDLIVVVTFWLPVDLRFLRISRMVRLLKVFGLDHFEESLHDIADGLRRRKALMVVSVTLMLVCIYVSSSLVYQAEHHAQPALFSSIPATFWWSMETLTTVGYGDMVPVTPSGKLFAGLISLFGIGIFALPAAIVTAAIVEAGGNGPARGVCPRCGKDVTDPLPGEPGLGEAG